MYLRNGIKFKNNNMVYILTDFNKSFRLVMSCRNFRVLGPTNMAAEEVILVLINFACKLRIRFATLFEKHSLYSTAHLGTDITFDAINASLTLLTLKKMIL